MKILNIKFHTKNIKSQINIKFMKKFKTLLKVIIKFLLKLIKILLNFPIMDNLEE